jgi:DNA-binding NarL/FixJ family response regulator
MDKIKVFIVDDHPIFKNGLIAQLKEFKYLEIIGTAKNGQEFLDLIDLNLPEIVFMDIKMPEMNGIEASKRAIEKYPDIKIIALTMFGDEEYLQSMLDIGVKGYLLKNIEKDDLEKAIIAVNSDKCYFSEELQSILAEKFTTKHKVTEQIKFTTKELEILKLICQGYTNYEIGEMLFKSNRTIDGFRANLLSKVGAKNTVGLVTYAIKNKLVEI